MSAKGRIRHRGLKLNTETEGQTQHAMHLFTQIPITYVEGNSVFSATDSNQKKTQTLSSRQSLSPLRSARQNSSLLGPQVTFKEALTQRRGKQSLQTSNNALKRQRVRNICRNVIRKMRMNNIFGPTVDEEELEHFRMKEAVFGWQMAKSAQNWWDAAASVVMLLLFLSQTFLLVFRELRNSIQTQILMILGMVVFSGQLLINFLSVRRERGHKVRALSQIAYTYLTGEFCIDVSFLLVMVMQLLADGCKFSEILVGLSVLKVNSLLGKLHRIQRWVFKTEYYQRYWSLLKIMLFNFAFAHAIAIALNLMAINNPGQNWQEARGISSASWVQKYVWSYYWATTIMLTVGFGDICPTTYHEAIWVIVIQIVSCIAFSYNISCLGTLIASIRSQGDLINRNRKVFQNFAEKRNLPQELTERILHYIDESGQVKARFSIVQEREMIGQLPQSFRTQVLAESNKTLLKSLTFFNQILLRAICELSKRLQRNVYFPQQTIKYARSDPHVYILEKGEVGFACRVPGSVLDRLYANTIKITHKQEPFLLSMDFLKKECSKYDIRAKDYSIVHSLSFEDFKSTLSAFPKDYEYFCFLRDRAKVVLDEHQTVPCQECKQKHTRFTCPRLHFIPLKEHVIHRQIHSRAITKEDRTITFQRILRKRENSLVRDKLFLSERDRAFLADLQGDSSEQTASMPSFGHLRTEGVLGQLKMRTAEYNGDNQQHFGEIYNGIKMIQLRHQLKEKEEAQSDEVWLLSCDTIEEYSIFFPENNLKNIIARRKKAKYMRTMQPFSQL